MMTPEMLRIISSACGIIYFVHNSSCNVKMNGIMLKIDRIGDKWFIHSPNQRFYDWIAAYGYSPVRGSILGMKEGRVIDCLNYAKNVNVRGDKNA